MNLNTILNAVIGTIALAALVIGIINFCKCNKENVDTQFIALRSLKPYRTDLESLSVSDTIEQWLSDRGITFDTGVNIKKPLNCTDATFSSVTSTGAGNFGTTITAAGAGNFGGGVSSTGTGSFGAVTTTGAVTAQGVGAFSEVTAPVVSAPVNYTDRIVSLTAKGDSAISLSQQLISLENYKSNGMIRAMCYDASSSGNCTGRVAVLATASDHGTGWDEVGVVPNCLKTDTMSAAYTNGQGPKGAG